MEKEKNMRRSFLKYLLSLVAFGISFFFSFKKDEGFKIGKFNTPSINTPKAYGTCGAGLGCAGGGGMCGAGLGCAGGGGACGAGLGCAGGQGDPSPRGQNQPGGAGMCGAGLGCAGGGGMCGAGLGCAGGGGRCGAGLGCAGN
jgi:hypothetical protein